MIIAFVMVTPDGDGHFFEEAPSEIFCAHCDTLIDRSYSPSNLKMRRAGYEVSCTYDNGLIVSDRFKVFCESQGFKGVAFKSVNAARGLYSLQSTREIRVDALRTGTRFLDRCQFCGEYESVVGAIPLFLAEAGAPMDGFFRTDPQFGSGREKTPLILVGPNTKEKIETAGFKRPEFHPVVRS